MFCFLMVMQDHFVLEGLVAVETEWPQAAHVSLFSPHPNQQQCIIIQEMTFIQLSHRIDLLFAWPIIIRVYCLILAGRACNIEPFLGTELVHSTDIETRGHEVISLRACLFCRSDQGASYGFLYCWELSDILSYGARSFHYSKKFRSSAGLTFVGELGQLSISVQCTIIGSKLHSEYIRAAVKSFRPAAYHRRMGFGLANGGGFGDNSSINCKHSTNYQGNFHHFDRKIRLFIKILLKVDIQIDFLLLQIEFSVKVNPAQWACLMRFQPIFQADRMERVMAILRVHLTACFQANRAFHVGYFPHVFMAQVFSYFFVLVPLHEIKVELGKPGKETIADTARCTRTGTANNTAPHKQPKKNGYYLERIDDEINFLVTGQ